MACVSPDFLLQMDLYIILGACQFMMLHITAYVMLTNYDAEWCLLLCVDCQDDSLCIDETL